MAVKVNRSIGGGGSFAGPTPVKHSPFDFRAKQPQQGIGGFLSGIGGSFSDLGRGFGNTLSDIGDFLGSRPATTKAGSGVFGPDNPVVKKPVIPKAAPHAQPTPTAEQPPLPNDPTPQVPDLLSFLGQAMDVLRNNGGLAGGGTDYSALKNELRGQYTENDAKLAAMYNQLRSSYANDAPAIAKGYDDASTSVGANTAHAEQTTNDAYQAARDAQTQQLQALGIQDAAAVLASQGGKAASDQAQANANLAQNGSAVQNNLTEHKAAAGNYNTNIEHAAGLEGSLQRANLTQQLQSALAKLDTQQSSENAQAGQTNFSNALSLAGQLYTDANHRSDQAAAQKQAEAAAQAAALKQQYQQYMDQQNLGAKTQSTLATLYPALLKQYGGDDKKATAAAKALGLL